MANIQMDAVADTRRRPRGRVSALQIAQDLKREQSDLFSPWDGAGIRDALIERGIPPSALDDMVDHWLSLHRRDLDPAYEVPTRATRAEIDATKAKVVRRLFDLVLSNGKRLADCTREDVMAEGGWYRDIARKMKPGQIVGAVFTPRDLQAMLGRRGAKARKAPQ